MKIMVTLLSLASASAFAISGPTAPYNEAVRIEGGRRVVTVAPLPAHMQHAIKSFRRPDGPEVASTDRAVIETPDGLMDCAGTFWYHPNACSPSTFGREKRYRTWVVLMGGKWFTCGSYTSAKTCTPLIVDGKLRPIPAQQE